MKFFISSVLSLIATFLPGVALAAPVTYTLMAPIGSLPASVTLKQYMNGMFETIIGLAGMLAVIMIVVCAIRLMGTGSVSGKSEAKQCIWNAIFGVLLAIGSWILLNTINPQLLRNDADLTVVAPAPAASAPPPSSSSGTYSWDPGPTCPSIAGKIVGMVAPSLCPAPAPGPLSICCRYIDIPLPAPVPPGLPAPVPPGLPPPPPPPPPGLGFSSANYSVAETAGGVIITVTRTGPIGGTLTIDYTTSDTNALAGSDYTSISGTLTFLPGVMTQTFSVPILDDALLEGAEKFQVKLSNPSFGVTITKGSAFILIMDNEVPPPPPPPGMPPPPPPSASDPKVLISMPSYNFFNTTNTLYTTFSVTEDVLLDNVTVTATDEITGNVVFTKVICSTTSSVCPPLILATTTALVTLGAPDNYRIDVTACDAAGNCGSDTRFGTYATSCAPTDSRCKNDKIAEENCYGKPVAGACIKADLDSNGIINDKDMTLFASSSLYDFNFDGVVNLVDASNNLGSTCTFHSNGYQWFVNPPVNPPTSKCALSVFGDIPVNKLDLQNAYTSAMNFATQKFDLTMFQMTICSGWPFNSYSCFDDGLGNTVVNTQDGEVAIATFRDFDLNDDGIVDLNSGSADLAFVSACQANPKLPNCVRADMNKDGYVTAEDMIFIYSVVWTFPWFAPFQLAQMEVLYYSGVLQPDRGIMAACQGATPVALLCARADLDKNNIVNAADTAIFSAASKYDINGDGLIIFSPQAPPVHI